MQISKSVLSRAIVAALVLGTSLPASARFLSRDPVQTNPNTGESFNRYHYANNNPYKFIDPDGREITCVSNACTVNPTGSDLPSINYPRPAGHPASISSSTNFHHEYRFDTPAGSGDGAYHQRLTNELVNSPTPVAGQAATPQGKRIDANANNDISVLTGADHVMSYKVDLANGGTAVLNVTEGDHAGKWGIVMRVVQSGPDGAQSIATYGEGNSAAQSIFDPNNNQSREVWEKNSQEIVRTANDP